MIFWFPEINVTRLNVVINSPEHTNMWFVYHKRERFGEDIFPATEQGRKYSVIWLEPERNYIFVCSREFITTFNRVTFMSDE